MRDRRTQRLPVAVNILVPKNLALRPAHAGQKKLQIALLFQSRIRQRRRRSPPQHLSAAVRILHHQGAVAIAVQRICRRIRLPARVLGQNNLRGGPRNFRRRQRRRLLPLHSAEHIRHRLILRKKCSRKHSRGDHVPAIGDELFQPLFLLMRGSLFGVGEHQNLPRRFVRLRKLVERFFPALHLISRLREQKISSFGAARSGRIAAWDFPLGSLVAAEQHGTGDEQGENARCRKQQPAIFRVHLQWHPSFSSCSSVCEKVRSLAPRLAYHASSKIRVSAVRVSRCSLELESNRRYSRGVRARSGFHVPWRSRKEIPAQYARWIASRHSLFAAASRASESQIAHSFEETARSLGIAESKSWLDHRLR